MRACSDVRLRANRLRDHRCVQTCDARSECILASIGVDVVGQGKALMGGARTLIGLSCDLWSGDTLPDAEITVLEEVELQRLPGLDRGEECRDVGRGYVRNVDRP